MNQLIETTNVIKLAGSTVGLIDIGNNEYLAVRAVANNEHSYIDTFYGIQTCIDMALTELSVVGAKPLGVLNLMRFGQYDQIANQKLFLNAVNGIGQYTNAYGIPAIGGEIYFHKQYNMSTMINSCAIGLLKTSNPLKKEKPPIGTSVIYIGAKTGLDGLRREKTEGLTGVANRKDNKTIKISDPLLSNRLINACYEAISKGLMKDVVSANVGGLGTACFDLAARIENPIRLEINRIPLKTEGLSPKDILLSESGDRLLALAPKEDHRKLVDIFHKWDIDSTVVGQSCR